MLVSTAGSLVHKMGLPVLLVCAVNENDIVHRALSTRDFTLSKNVLKTWSSAMDIQVIVCSYKVTQHQHVNSQCCSLHISYGITWESLAKYHQFCCGLHLLCF